MPKRTPPTIEEQWRSIEQRRDELDTDRGKLADELAGMVERGEESESGLARRLGCSRTAIRGMLGKRKRYPSQA